MNSSIMIRLPLSSQLSMIREGLGLDAPEGLYTRQLSRHRGFSLHKIYLTPDAERGIPYAIH